MVKRRTAALLPAAALLLMGACEEERPPLPGASGGTAGISRRTEAAPEVADVETGAELPLKREGIGSIRELERVSAGIENAALRARFEEGFRRCFVEERGKRDYRGAREAMEEVLGDLPEFAPAYRVLAYTRLNTGFDMAGATRAYERAVELDPDYGEAHYALSFMLTQFDPERGRTHFEKAMALGVPDERELGKQFYR